MVAAASAVDEPRAQRLAAEDGVVLALDEYGDAHAPAVVLAHGFGQTRSAWCGTALAIARTGWRAITYDARGHGDSTRLRDGGYRVDQFVDDLRRVCAHAGNVPIVVGASMGGLVGIVVASAEPSPCRALVLVDITPRWEAAGVARIVDFMRAHPHGFADLDEAAGAIAAYLPHRGERKSPERLRTLLVAGTDGRLRWHWDPRMLAPIAEDGERHQGDLLAAARRLRVPTLLVSGAESDVVSAATIGEFLELVPHARHVTVPRATHMVAGDANDAFLHHVDIFLRGIDAATPTA
ncbi:MAG: alpha/beta hydrolase [Xanthomonadales bacterium]|nr:alpha/beta hydrolase [Xanthomonadales bacterium]